MKIEDYSKYYIQGSDHYLVPKDIFVELFNEMINWKEESKNQKEIIDKANRKLDCIFANEDNENILDDIEKEYLKAVIKPFKDRVNYIEKKGNINEYISIDLITETISLPYFKEGTMYKEMELNKKYTLKELELDDKRQRNIS